MHFRNNCEVCERRLPVRIVYSPWFAYFADYFRRVGEMSVEEKMCRGCKRRLPRSAFYTPKSPLCKPCNGERGRAWRDANREQVRASGRNRYAKKATAISARNKSARRNRRGLFLIKGAKVRAAKKGVAFDLDGHVADVQALIDAGTCQLTGLPFDLESPAAWNSPSLDRIEPDKGYTWGNVRVICHAMNCALGTWGEDVLRRVIGAWLDRAGAPVG